jgi:hypothetical protein|tara:strand:- start:355 stop:546 length:192 start_codon:yes stop_codon:yes gene_type:complete
MPSKKGSHPSVKRVVKIKNKTYRATGVIKVPVEQYSKKKDGKSKDSDDILKGIDDEFTIDELT